MTLVLAAAVALQLGYRLREQPSTKLAVPLTRVLPQALEGWVVSEEQLGATEGGTAGALRQLNVEDYVYRRYERQGKAFTIYAAHWPPGRMPTRLVASHTPDRCWTENGMQCVKMRFRERYRVGSLALAPAEYRVFQWPDGSQRSHVVYWHMVENKAYDFGSRFNAAPHPWLWWKDTVAQAVYGSREQLFVRIVSEVPMAEWWKEPGFVAVLSSVKGIADVE